ncbi:hypothetical protein [Mucilaginibacter gotjawali]|uniref:Uncharacterized protein n=2 Tax=Mucilaginibacter gotjawali TaxID=1550579 RepID=A0A0X8X461_9SPHI|nr:hypothetical protein [Mucilaginibacter gotjawali]MBB3058247.1 hypothetical protein [Mucilaginibacter gotjawali]BAU54797.1 hypothetical protein MgSA37_02975 [Mucilaginibacter gotjawali]
MKVRSTILSIILFCIVIKTKGQSEPIEKQWVKEDSVFIQNLAKIYKENPLKLTQILSYQGNKREKLGFDYYLISGSNGKGYVSVFYQFVYYKNEVVSFKLDPQMPGDARLIVRYARFYSQLFNINKDHLPEPLYFGYKEMSKPINGFSGAFFADGDIRFFMTPYSGIMYGDNGGDPISALQNRVNYLKIKKRITPQICELLLGNVVKNGW